MFSSTNPGVVQIFYDEQNTTTVPTLAEASERYMDSLSAGDIRTKKSYKWTNSDPLDLQYTPIANYASYQPAAFKIFTNNTNFGSSVAATDYCEVEGYYRFQFRDLVGV
jgi:hypothetical protein